MRRRRATQGVTGAFEQALAASGAARLVLRLYVSGATPRSARAIETVKALCELHARGRYELEVIDLYQQPERAKTAQIIATPTLVRELPEPLRHLVGDLSDPNRLLISLNLAPEGK